MRKQNKLVLSMATAIILSNNIYAKETKSLDTITVTAQKVEEDAKDVPIAMNVFDEYLIEDKQIDDVIDIANSVPGFYVFNLGGTGTVGPTLRGVHSDYRTTSSSVAMYVDGVPTLGTTGYNIFLYDIERIEVLKGPQSTLYGKNAQAGVLNIITRKPNNETKGKVTLELGEDNKREASFQVSGPIVKDKFFAGFAARYYEKDGYIKNTYLNTDHNYRENYSGRLNLRYLASDKLEFSLMGNKEKRDDGGTSSSSVYRPDPYNYGMDLADKNDLDSDSIGFKINYTINKNNSIEAITAYKKGSLLQIADFDQTTIPSAKQHAYFPINQEYLSQEIRYNLKQDNYNLLVGLYADKSEDKNKNEFESAYGTFIYGHQKVDGKSLGVFAHVDYQITDKLSVLGGLRYDKDKKELDNKVSLAQEEDSFSEISPKLALKYKLNNNTLAFATIAKGYKPGGYYIFAPQGQEYYDQETLISYELGLKSSFLDNRLNLNTSLYYIDISDKQIVVPVSNLANYIRSADSATSKGLEIELNYKVTDTFSVNSSFAYNKATFDDFKYTSAIFDQNYNIIGTQDIDNSGNYMPNTPKYTYTLGATYRGNNGIYANAQLSAIGTFQLDDTNTFKREPYKLVDAKIGYETENFDIYLYGKNIFDEEYDTYEHYSMGYIFLSKPREVGIQLAYRF